MLGSRVILSWHLKGMRLDYAGLHQGWANQEAGAMVQLSHCLNQLDKLTGDHRQQTDLLWSSQHPAQDLWDQILCTACPAAAKVRYRPVRSREEAVA